MQRENWDSLIRDYRRSSTAGKVHSQQLDDQKESVANPLCAQLLRKNLIGSTATFSGYSPFHHQLLVRLIEVTEHVSLCVFAKRVIVVVDLLGPAA